MATPARPGMRDTVLAGSVAGMASTVACHPLDTLRTRLQTDAARPRRQFSGALDCLRQTVRQEGPRALYKGMAGPLAAQGLYKAVMFGSFRLARDALPRSGSLADAWACGVFAGLVNSLFVCPIELVRNRLMVQRGSAGGVNVAAAGSEGTARRFRGAMDCVRQTVREPGGVLALWTGLQSTMLRDGPGVGMWFACFELAKRHLPRATGWAPDSSANLLCSGAAGGVGFWLVALPFDAIKSNVQTTGSSMRAVVQRTGLRGLYVGFGLALVRGVPGAGLVFLVQKRVLEALAAQS